MSTASKDRIRLTRRGELVLGSLAGVVALFTMVIGFAVLGDFLGI